MSFSKEDKAAWNNSEIMQEFEKIAAEMEIFNGPPEEAYLPIKNADDDWEDEINDDVENKNIEAENKKEDFLKIAEFEKNLLEKKKTVDDKLINDLRTLSEKLISKRKIEAAYKVERAILDIEAHLQTEENNDI